MKRANPAMGVQTSTPLEAGSAHSPTRWLGFIRLAWYPAFAIALGVFIASIPGFFIIGSGGVADPRFSANPSPLIGVLDWISILGAMAAGLLSLFLAALLFRRRSGDLMALMTSFYLLGYGVIMTGPFEALEPFFPGIASFTYNFLMPGFVPFSLLLFAIFPDGRFVPRWTRWAVLVAFLTIPFALFWTSLYTQGPLDFSDPVVLISTGVAIVLVAATWLSTLYAQIYRYRNVSTAEQRQQTKWVVYGTGVWLSLQMILTVPWIYSFSLPPGTTFPLWLSVSGLLWVLFIAVIPVTLTIAVMRYRLFEIDSIINRTLVYGALTAIVVVMYALLVGALGVLLHAQVNLIIALLATGLVAVLFQPLRERLQRGINRIMYGERDEPFTVLRRLGQRLESSGVPEEMLPAIVETVCQALKLPYAEVTLRQGEEFVRAARYGETRDDLVPFPIQFQGQTVGYLKVALRGQSEPLGKSDEGLLRQIARQAGPIAQAVQLTRDLRQSRARLVTAQEEERSRLRRDLHDGLGPVLASQGLKIAAVSHLMESDPETAQKLLNDLAFQNEATVSEIRRLVYALRPPELDELGLVGAVRDYAVGLNGSTAQATHFQVRVQSAGEERMGLPAAIEVSAYRIATEALTNVARHAMAHSCLVYFSLEEKESERVLLLRIVDDGIGFANKEKAGIGLTSMRERAKEVGGSLKIESNLHKGTKVVARFPLIL